jgi:hypothetical protein
MAATHLTYIGRLAFAFALALALSHCKSKKQEIPPFGDIHLQVLDENKVPVDSATIYLYNDKNAFDLAAANAKKGVYNGNGSIAIGKIVSGQIIFPDVPSNTEYWVLAHDTSGVFQGTTIPIDRDNVDAYYNVPSFQNGTKVTAIVHLVPGFSLVNFSAGTQVTFTNIHIGDTTYKSLPPYGIKVRKGTLPYFIRSDYCVWTGSVDAVAGKVETEILTSCDYGQVTFSYSPNATSNFSASNRIDVYIGQNKSKPILSLRASNLSKSAELAPGNAYTYYAELVDTVANKKTCVWEGLITPNVTGTSTASVSLSPCQ